VKMMIALSMLGLLLLLLPTLFRAGIGVSFTAIRGFIAR